MVASPVGSVIDAIRPSPVLGDSCVLLPVPSWKSELSPQALTSPSARRASEWYCAALMSITLVPAAVTSCMAVKRHVVPVPSAQFVPVAAVLGWAWKRVFCPQALTVPPAPAAPVSTSRL